MLALGWTSCQPLRKDFPHQWPALRLFTLPLAHTCGSIHMCARSSPSYAEAACMLEDAVKFHRRQPFPHLCHRKYTNLLDLFCNWANSTMLTNAKQKVRTARTSPLTLPVAGRARGSIGEPSALRNDKAPTAAAHAAERMQ